MVTLCVIASCVVYGSLFLCNRTAGKEIFGAHNKLAAATRLGRSADHAYRVFVFTYARPDGLKETLTSLLNADYSKASAGAVDLEVFVDYRRSESPQLQEKQSAIIQMLRDFAWPHGGYKIHQRLINAGLRLSIMEAWQPTSDREVAAFFEDDVVVSPYWFSWVHDALGQYAPVGAGNIIEADPHFVGFALFRPIFDELSRRRVEVKNSYAPFLLQQPCSWGAVYLPGPWRRFREFFEREKENDLRVRRLGRARNPTSNYWNHNSSWKKYLIYYMYRNGLYMMYPNLPEKLVLSTSRLLPGEHPTPSRKLFVLSLVQKEHLRKELVERSLSQFTSMKDMKVFDVMFNEAQSVDALLPKGG
ncbi:uncharacterized protein Tco025E_01200 [Trypanosoma conorhini]|uniref:Uncharacterized protein n=1 Tax=Trypanosoma conorhini TaxID=83891 RepID=A0A422Q926_9TRYP|nr:uncharacterized protein Tco025E_01200 [Trypanosoma conorhini]RNF26495.1 hypothetical protein Tco025E_01200 [Trypanosoma conorhini]